MLLTIQEVIKETFQMPVFRSAQCINSTGGLAVLMFLPIAFSVAIEPSTPSIASGVSGCGVSVVSSTEIAGSCGLSPWSSGWYTTTVLPVRRRVIGDVSESEIAEVASCGCAWSFAKASARSSGWTTLFGASSSRISQPIGGEGGGEMKNSLSLLGNGKCWSDGFMGVLIPK